MRKQTKLWTQEDGNRIRICDMGDKYLVACVNTLRRYGHLLSFEKLKKLLELQNTVGLEPALDAFANSHWSDYVPTIFWKMIDDIKRRAALRPGILKNLIGIPNWILE